MNSLASIIVVIWAIFWIFWFIAAFGSKKSATYNIRRFAGIRIVIFILAVILFRSVDIQKNSFSEHLITNNSYAQIAGFILFLLGLMLAIWARAYLGKNWGMPMSQKENPELVTSGPYSFIRHPIYSGVILAVIGSVIVGGVYWLIFLAIMGSYFIYSAIEEEKLMAEQFPKIYPEYKRKTKMLIPFIF